LRLATIALLFISVVTVGQTKDNIDYKEINIFCLDYSSQDKKEIVINKKADYKKLVNKRITWGACKDQPVPKVNFKRETLLGYYLEIKGCAPPDLRIELTKGMEDNYALTAYLKQNGTCDTVTYSKMNLILVDKIRDKKIDFKTVLE
jgi:hypothetical protein